MLHRRFADGRSPISTRKFELEFTMDEAALAAAPFFSKVRGAVAYLYFLREWWPAGNDVVAFWREPAGTCRRFAAATGEQVEDSTPFEVLHDDVLSPAAWDEIIAFVVDRGILDVTGAQPQLTTAHCTDAYAVRLDDGRHNVFVVPGAKLRDPKANEICEVFLGPHSGVAEFYCRDDDT